MGGAWHKGMVVQPSRNQTRSTAATAEARTWCQSPGVEET
jgi:hypothetical protein